MFLKDSREKFLNYLKNECDKSKISNKSLGIWIRCFHLNAPFSMILIIIFATKDLSNVILFSGTMALCLFFIFDGCFLSKLEQYLCEDSYTIIDPLLEIQDIEINHKNRNKYTFICMTVFSCVFFPIYYYRFIHKHLE
jgi:hypothetical protein